MAERKRIALNYQVGYDFSAGIAIYIQNIIKALNRLPDNRKPHLTLICSRDSPVSEIRSIAYPYLDYYNYKAMPRSIVSRGINKITRELFHFNLIKRYSFPRQFDILYPFFDCDETLGIQNRFYWKPDFQEMHYPQYISKQEYDYTITYMNNVSQHESYTLILSSEDCLNDYRKFFSSYRNQVNVLPFVSLLPDLTSMDQNKVREKYDITLPYFMVANQFWPHKNHRLVLEAILRLKSERSDFQVVFSGKQSSYRDLDYFTSLKKFIDENGISGFVRFIGFVPREEQILLMKQSIAVIQPSLFEGWSTVIEDCKALNHFVLASDLAVNREQLEVNFRLFNPHSFESLASLMHDLLEHPVKTEAYDYTLQIDTFIRNLISIFQLETIS